MSMTEVDTKKIDNSLGLVFGDENAPITIVEYINLRCPFCKQWWDERSQLIDQYVANGKVKQVIKLFDKDKESLQSGNVMHHHVPNDNTAKAAITKIYATQSEWGSLDSLDEVANYAVDKLGFTHNPATEELSKKIALEAKENGVFFIPTMIVGDQVFDQKISEAELTALLEGSN
ncbi:hypothetical protein CBF34_04825 [Vagococcus penaei]|uniref:Uncharacterized protein n=1 Tax=Vagococcus penaei TaxID=633807 RepID=A0A1Q2D4L3_9ENTE|nr:thioredoxin domain-containing protein [Vagococcus penaei]AQP53346.1 hypothetical protein BW732_03250 [Vagococcus penaei]RSU04117.1 hypothetical protein CBF34_04825 [Vagococcus penaei]